MNYYNEFDKFAAAWLRELIAAGRIAPGEVDERSIEDVQPNDLRGFTQCHFFAGIGVWSYALRAAGWPDSRQVWTGSCPCQPFSTAGQRKGTADERHLWPAFFHLIQSCHPDVVFGEQVASKDGLAWFDTVSSDLEAASYSCGAADLCAAGFGAPHIRQRLFFVANSNLSRKHERTSSGEQSLHNLLHQDAACIGVGDANNARPQGRLLSGHGGDERIVGAAGLVGSSLEHAGGQRRERGEASAPGHDNDGAAPERPESEHGARLTSSYWGAADWLPCRDGKYRPVEPGTFPLAHGAPARVGRLRGYGNALVAPVAQAFISAAMEVLEKETR